MLSKLALIILSFTLLFVGSLATPAYAAFNGDPLNQACTETGVDNPACNSAASQGTNDPIAGPNGLIRTVANIVAMIGGIIAVVFIVIGALGFITSGGDSQKAATARSRVLSGVIGLVIIALAWAIVSIVAKIILQT